MHIVRAEPRDAVTVADIHVRAWQAGYRELLPQDHLKGIDVRAKADRYELDLTLPEGPVTLLAAGEDGAVAGFTTIGRCRDKGSPDGEVWALYVDPDRWREGIGTLLIGSARDELQHHEFRHAALWVMERNVRARQFYERDGWCTDGQRRVETIGTVPVNEVRYRRRLC